MQCRELRTSAEPGRCHEVRSRAVIQGRDVARDYSAENKREERAGTECCYTKLDGKCNNLHDLEYIFGI